MVTQDPAVFILDQGAQRWKTEPLSVLFSAVERTALIPAFLTLKRHEKMSTFLVATAGLVAVILLIVGRCFSQTSEASHRGVHAAEQANYLFVCNNEHHQYCDFPPVQACSEGLQNKAN